MRESRARRQYLNDSLARDLVKDLSQYFQSEVEIPRIRMGKRQEIETMINEEALLLAKYLRSEIIGWQPRVVDLNLH